MKRLLLGFLLFALIELTLLIEAGEAFGTWFPIAAVVLSGFAGTAVIRHYGFQTMRRLKDILRSGVPTGGPRSAGLAGIVAGILLILPGFLSDLAAVLLLIPTTRRFAASLLGLRLSSGPFPGGRRDPYGPTIEAEAVEIRAEVGMKGAIQPPSPWRR